ncbi:uncharacterized protein LOC112595492 [Melanaphis sacchari]|uniref:uncharacterized protein LOC112595492 n=1 Tax=Melanaphis sacchari TaxID=742174 RepID=UPI000DC15923|nr:uncharacterized protein LOC112595492 [Melanaphis sacchari]
MKNMFTGTLLVCLFAAVSVIIPVSAEKKYNNQSELMDDTIDKMFECMQELDINPDVCGELVLKNKNHNDKRYDNCKCIGPCVGKKMGTMDSVTGKWNWAKLEELSTLLENETLKNEAKLLHKHCFDEVNTHCVAGYAIMKCIMEHSEMAKDMIKNYLATRDDAQNEDKTAT